MGVMSERDTGIVQTSSALLDESRVDCEDVTVPSSRSHTRYDVVMTDMVGPLNRKGSMT